MTEEILNQELESFDKQLPPESKNLVDGKDWADNLSNYIYKTIIRNLLDIAIKEKLRKWSDKFEKACKDGLTEDSKKSLMSELDDITEFGEKIISKYNL